MPLEKEILHLVEMSFFLVEIIGKLCQQLDMANMFSQLIPVFYGYISILIKSSKDWQWNEMCKNYIQLDQLKK